MKHIFFLLALIFGINNQLDLQKYLKLFYYMTFTVLLLRLFSKSHRSSLESSYFDSVKSKRQNLYKNKCTYFRNQ